jgi:hypothetical protein
MTVLAVVLVTPAVLTISAHGQVLDPTTTGTSRQFNPAISLNALILGHYLDAPEEAEEEHGHDEHEHGGAPPEGLSLQELELRFTADVDAYARANATVAFHEGEIEVEEAYADFLALPAGLGIRGGVFYAPFSRENTLHTHQLPFTQRSLAQRALWGEAWTAPGVQLGWLPSWPFYTEFRVAAMDGKDAEWFGSEKDGGYAGLGQIVTMFDLSESTTLGLQGGFTTGQHGFVDEELRETATSQAASAGVDLRWKPARKTIYRGLRLNWEYTWGKRDNVTAIEEVEEVEEGGEEELIPVLDEANGWSAYAQFQFARRWWVSGRYDWLDAREVIDLEGTRETNDQTRWGASISWVASEFQALRLEFSQTDDGMDTESSVFLQYNVTIGSHPAHLY